MKNKNISKEILDLLAKAGQIVRYDPEQMIYFQYENQKSFYFIRKGRARAFFNTDDGREMTLEVIGEGRFFGENTFLSESGRLNSMQAVSQVELVCCTLDELLPVLQTCPELLKSFLGMLAETNANLSRQVLRLSFMDAPARVADLLLQISDDPDPSLHIINGEIPYTHFDIACSVNLTRSTVSRILKNFEKEGLVHYGYGKVRILNPEGLRKKIV